MNKLLDFLKTIPIKPILDQFDIVSGAVLFIIAVNILAMGWYALVHGKAIDNALITWSLGIVAAKTGHGIMTAGKDDASKPQ